MDQATKDLIQATAVATVQAHRVAKKEDPFHIDAKSHYDQHQAMGRFLSFWDSTTSTVGIYTIRVILILVLIVLVLGTAAGVWKVHP